MTAIMTFQINIWPRLRVLSFFYHMILIMNQKLQTRKSKSGSLTFFFKFRIVQSISFSSNWHILHFDGKTCYVTSLLIGTENYYQQDHLR
jgi:hypothetical protein